MGQKIDRELHTLKDDTVDKIVNLLSIQTPITDKDTCIIDIKLFIHHDFKEGNYGQVQIDFIQ